MIGGGKRRSTWSNTRRRNVGRQDPKFTKKVIKLYKTALARQVAEAVRRRRRGREPS